MYLNIGGKNIIIIHNCSTFHPACSEELVSLVIEELTRHIENPEIVIGEFLYVVWGCCRQIDVATQHIVQRQFLNHKLKFPRHRDYCGHMHLMDPQKLREELEDLIL